MIQTVNAVMQLFKGSYFSVDAGLRYLWPNSAIAKGSMYVNYVSRASNWSLQRFTNETLDNIWYLDIDFNLEVCVIVFLEAWTRADFLKLYRVNIIP